MAKYRKKNEPVKMEEPVDVLAAKIAEKERENELKNSVAIPAEKPVEKQPEIKVEKPTIVSVAKEAVDSTIKNIKEVTDEAIKNIKEKAHDSAQDFLNRFKNYFDEKYFNLLKRNGFDAYHKGTWQKMYVVYMDKIFKLAKKNILDLGCAMGSQTSAFADYGCKAIGVDISEYAKAKSPFKNITFLNTPAWDLKDVESDSIDFVNAMYVLNFIPQDKLETLFKELNRVCKKDARIFIVFNPAPTIVNVSESETYFPIEYINNIAKNNGLVDETQSYYKLLMETSAPGWEFMRYYNWKYVLYRKA
jgi:SAM-dependent methyltransferase